MTIAHQRTASPSANNATASARIQLLSGNSNIHTNCLSERDRATKTPAMMLTMITTQIIPRVLLSCFVPVLLRDRRVIVSSNSDAK